MADLNVIRVVNHDTVTVANTSTELLAANPRRLYAEIVNTSNEAIWIKLGAAPAVGDGIYIAPNGFSYEILPENLWRGSVYGICASGGKVAAIVEGQ